MLYPQVRKKLAEMRSADQEAFHSLTKITEDSEKNAEATSRMEMDIDKLLERHLQALKSLFATYGFLGYHQVGKEGASDFWLLVQHCDRDPQFQESVLVAMESEVNAGNASNQEFAYLTDRVRVNQGRPQVFGTQLELNKMGNSYVSRPCVAPAELNRRRSSIGLEPIELYLQRHNALFL